MASTTIITHRVKGADAKALVGFDKETGEVIVYFEDRHDKIVFGKLRTPVYVVAKDDGSLVVRLGHESIGGEFDCEP